METSWLRIVVMRMREMFATRRNARELDEELRAHFEMLVEQNVQGGMSPTDARRVAQQQLGGREQIKEAVHDQRGLPFLESLLSDVRYAARMLRKSPGFTIVAVLTLALGIGANTAIFSAVNGILLKSVPYPSFSRLIEISSEKTSGDGSGAVGMIVGLSPAAVPDIRKDCTAFQGLTEYEFGNSYTLTDQTAPALLTGTSVAGNFFTFFGVQPLLGRPILPPDTKPGNSNVAVLSFQTWNSLFGGDPHVIGRNITLNGKRYKVIGVMPSKFERDIGPKNGIWLPRIEYAADAKDRSSRFLGVVARLKPSVSFAQGQAQLSTLAAALAAAYPKTDKGWTIIARDPFMANSDVQEGLLLLLGASGFVLLIACANVSSLLLARGWARQKEIAVREALGAGRLRLVRQFLSESVLLALAGAGIGLLVSVWVIRAMRVLAQPYTSASALEGVKLDGTVFCFTLGVALLCGIVFGLAPAMQSSIHRPGDVLREGSFRTGGDSFLKPRKMRSVLVVVEVALAVILVVGATLVGRSLENYMSSRLGFRTDHILTLGVNFSEPVCDSKKSGSTGCELAIHDVLTRVRDVSGVEGAGAASSIPGRGATIGMDARIEGRKGRVGFSQGAPILSRTVSPDFFEVFGIRVLKGRDFTGADTSNSPSVATVNETFAKEFLSNDPLGKRVSRQDDKNGQPEWMTIVGEVDDIRDFGLITTPLPELYLPFGQDSEVAGSHHVTIFVRTMSDPLAMSPAIKRDVWSVDKDAPITDLATMDQIVSADFAQQRFQAVLLGSFGALGLILAMIGVYGVVSYGVSRRTHEIGVRIALGAHPTNVLSMVFREGMLLAGIGIVLGIVGALALTRVLRSLLFEIKPTDAATFAGVAVLLVVVALVACLVPARRAMGVDPMTALRHE